MIRIMCKSRVEMVCLYSFGHASAVICSKYSVIRYSEYENWCNASLMIGCFAISYGWTKSNRNVILIGRFVGD